MSLKDPIEYRKWKGKVKESNRKTLRDRGFKGKVKEGIRKLQNPGY